MLKSNFPEKNGVTNAWKFEKAHSILHKVREIILFGWSENFSTQGPEHCHIDFVKKIAQCTNNKEVFLTILRYHVREGHLQYLLKLRADLNGEEDEPGPGDDPESVHGHKNHQTLQVYCLNLRISLYTSDTISGTMLVIV